MTTTKSPSAPTAPPAWQRLNVGAARGLADARLQFHHAAQFAAAIGISFLPPRSDDSHTNLEWVPSLGALASRITTTSTPFRLAVRPSKLAVLLVDANAEIRASCGLHGHTVDDGLRWLRVMFPDFGADARRYTLDRHFIIPPHPVASGAPFDTARTDRFDELTRWFGNAAGLLERVAAATPHASEVRCWPHHFDIATLIDVVPADGGAPARTVGVGLEPGDQYYAEPYFYLNMHPAPAAGAALPPLDGNGIWHTDGWIGAVLPASRLTSADQRAQADAFVASALAVCTQMVAAG